MALVIPAILTSDLHELSAKIEAVKSFAPWVQVDIMDGKFVSHATVAVSDLSGLVVAPKLEIHLMVADPLSYFADCAKARASRVYFHIESTREAEALLHKLDTLGIERGIALNPETDPRALQSLLTQKLVDAVLVMGVHPGASGQALLSETFSRITAVRALANSLGAEIKIEVDGGVTEGNIAEFTAAGADLIIANSAIFGKDNWEHAYQQLQALAGNTTHEQ